MGKLGRKRLPPAERKSTTVGVRFSFVERVGLCLKAQAAGCTMTQLIRSAALGLKLKPPVLVPTINREVWLELSQLATALKESLWRLNPDDQLARELIAVSGKLDEIRAQLRGDSCNDEDANEAVTSPIN